MGALKRRHFIYKAAWFSFKATPCGHWRRLRMTTSLCRLLFNSGFQVIPEHGWGRRRRRLKWTSFRRANGELVLCSEFGTGPRRSSVQVSVQASATGTTTLELLCNFAAATGILPPFIQRRDKMTNGQWLMPRTPRPGCIQ